MKKPIILIVDTRNTQNFTRFVHAYPVEIVEAPDPSKALDFLNRHKRVLFVAGGNGHQHKLFQEITRRRP